MGKNVNWVYGKIGSCILGELFAIHTQEVLIGKILDFCEENVVVASEKYINFGLVLKCWFSLATESKPEC